MNSGFIKNMDIPTTENIAQEAIEIIREIQEEKTSGEFLFLYIVQCRIIMNDNGSYY